MTQSAYEKDRIIPAVFETTNAGKDMLLQDYILKQLAASLTDPDKEIGKAFWKKVFKRVQNEFGSIDIPVSSFSKVWIVPDSAEVYEGKGSAFIFSSHLKVLTQEDYLSMTKNMGKLSIAPIKERKVDHISSEITREIILPELEREVNQGKYFAPLRQMYSALILAIWFKKRFREELIGQVYVDQKKTSGINLKEKKIKEKVYSQYLRALKKGAYNFIREDFDEGLNQVVPRKYFSGGCTFAQAAMVFNFRDARQLFSKRDAISILRNLAQFTVRLKPQGIKASTLMIWVADALGIRITKARLRALAGASALALASFNTIAAQDNSTENLQQQITSLKTDIAVQKKALNIGHFEVKGGQALSILSNIRFEQGQLEKLEKKLENETKPAAPAASAPVATPAVAAPTPPVPAASAPVATPAVAAPTPPVPAASAPVATPAVAAPTPPVPAASAPVAAPAAPAPTKPTEPTPGGNANNDFY